MDELIEDLTFEFGEFPFEAIQKAADSKETITPLLKKKLRLLVGELREDPEHSSVDKHHMLVLLLLAKFREKSAFPAICKLLTSEEMAIEDLYYTLSRNTISAILYSTFNGNFSAIESITVDQDVSVLVRGAALNTLGKLYEDGLIEREACLSILMNAVLAKKGDYHRDRVAIYAEEVVIRRKLTNWEADIGEFCESNLEVLTGYHEENSEKRKFKKFKKRLIKMFSSVEPVFFIEEITANLFKG